VSFFMINILGWWGLHLNSISKNLGIRVIRWNRIEMMRGMITIYSFGCLGEGVNSSSHNLVMLLFPIPSLKIVPNMSYLEFFSPPNHLTKSNVNPYIFCYTSINCRKYKRSVVYNLSHGTYHHLCIIYTPSI
jgi:hypothetical protein